MTKISKILVRKLKSDRIEYGAGGVGVFSNKKNLTFLKHPPPPPGGGGGGLFSNEQASSCKVSCKNVCMLLMLKGGLGGYWSYHISSH